MDKARFEERKSEALRLRAAWSDSGVEFFTYLCEWENDESTWKGDGSAGTGWLTFGRVLADTNIIKSHRLDHFKAVVAETPGGLDAVRTIGLDAAEELLRIPQDAPSRKDPALPARAAVVRDMTEFRERNGTTPSKMTAKADVKGHWEPPPKEREEEPTWDDENMRLKHEVDRLIKIVAAKNREIAAKDREIAKLSKSLAEAKAKTARARSGKASGPVTPEPAGALA